MCGQERLMRRLLVVSTAGHGLDPSTHRSTRHEAHHVLQAPTLLRLRPSLARVSGKLLLCSIWSPINSPSIDSARVRRIYFWRVQTGARRDTHAQADRDKESVTGTSLDWTSRMRRSVMPPTTPAMMKPIPRYIVPGPPIL